MGKIEYSLTHGDMIAQAKAQGIFSFEYVDRSLLKSEATVSYRALNLSLPLVTVVPFK